MNEQKRNEKPEVYALHQNGENWQISRRDFLKAAGIGAAAFGTGLSSGCSRTQSLDQICMNATSTDGQIRLLTASPDKKYLVSMGDGRNSTYSPDGEILTCWDFEKHILLGKSSKFRDTQCLATGWIDGKQAMIIKREDRVADASYIYVYDLPIIDRKEHNRSIRIHSVPELTSMAVDGNENLLAVYKNSIHLFSRESDYRSDDLLFDETPQGSLIQDIRLFDNDRFLFVRFEAEQDGKTENGYGVLALETKEMRMFPGKCVFYAVFSDGKEALVGDWKEYKRISLSDGSVRWSRTFEEFLKDRWIGVRAEASVSSDGKTGLIMTLNFLFLISMEDGSIIKNYSFEQHEAAKYLSGPALNEDDTQVAVSVGKSVFFLSLPDLEMVSCPMDLMSVSSDSGKKGVEISTVDSVTGETLDYTLPCGAAIPDGAVCTCNCVSGRGTCICVGHKSNSGSNSSGGGSHYWHPN